MTTEQIFEDTPLYTSISPADYTGNSEEWNDVTSHFRNAKEPVKKDMRFYIILCCMFINVFVAALDSTIVATLLPVIADDLQCLPVISWIATSYLLLCAAFQPVFGKFSDIFGRKSVCVFCSVIFSLGCLLCGIGNSFIVLVIGRAISGIGGGGFNTMSAIVLSDLVPLNQRGLYQGYVNIFFGIGSAMGGVFAGFFQKYFNWRLAFIVQVPICLISGILTFLYLNVEKEEEAETVEESLKSKVGKVDFYGSTVLVSSIFILMFAASIGGKNIPFQSIQFIVIVGAGLIGLIHFYYFEKGISNPVIPVKLLKNKTIFWSSLGCWVLSMNTYCILLYVPFFWESVLNLSSYESGVRLIPGSTFAIIGSIGAGLYIKEYKKYKKLLLISTFVNSIGSFLIFLSSDKEKSFYANSLILIPGQFGMTSIITIILIAMISSVNHSEHGLVTSIQYGFRSTGSTLGVSVASAILQSSLRKNLVSNFKDIGKNEDVIQKIIEKALLDTTYAFNKAPEFAKQLIISSYYSACQDVFKFIVFTSLVTVLCSFFIEENEL